PAIFSGPDFPPAEPVAPGAGADWPGLSIEQPASTEIASRGIKDNEVRRPIINCLRSRGRESRPHSSNCGVNARPANNSALTQPFLLIATTPPYLMIYARQPTIR